MRASCAFCQQRGWRVVTVVTYFGVYGGVGVVCALAQIFVDGYELAIAIETRMRELYVPVLERELKKDDLPTLGIPAHSQHRS